MTRTLVIFGKNLEMKFRIIFGDRKIRDCFYFGRIHAVFKYSVTHDRNFFLPVVEFYSCLALCSYIYIAGLNCSCFHHVSRSTCRVPQYHQQRIWFLSIRTVRHEAFSENFLLLLRHRTEYVERRQSSGVSGSTAAQGGCLNCRLFWRTTFRNCIGGGRLHTVNWDRPYITTKFYIKSTFSFTSFYTI